MGFGTGDEVITISRFTLRVWVSPSTLRDPQRPVSALSVLTTLCALCIAHRRWITCKRNAVLSCGTHGDIVRKCNTF